MWASDRFTHTPPPGKKCGSALPLKTPPASQSSTTLIKATEKHRRANFCSAPSTEANKEAETQVEARIWLAHRVFCTLNISTSSDSFEWVEKCHQQVHEDSQVEGNAAPEGHVASTPVQERLSCKGGEKIFLMEH